MKIKSKINMEILLIRLYILIIIFEGPIRYILNLFGMAVLIYVKDFILITLVIFGLKKMKFNRKHLILFIISCISFIASVAYVGNFSQIFFFILKVFVPFLAGIVQYKNIQEDINNAKSFYKMCFVVVIFGVYLNSVVEYPWEGLEYSVGNTTVSATKLWSTQGAKRIAGFSRSSFNSATYIMIFAMLIQLDKKNKNTIKLLCCAMAIGGITLTTTKGVLIASIIFYINDFLNMKKIKKILMKILIFLMIAIPIFSTMCEPIFDYLENNLEYTTYIKYFSSFRDRLTNTWPDALELATKHGNAILGRGMGGIGASQKTYELELYSPGDNFFVYQYVTFGVFVILIYYCIIKFVNKMNFKSQDYSIYIYNIFLVICAYGIVCNVVEEPFLCILLGSCIGYILKNSEERNKKQDENINS